MLLLETQFNKSKDMKISVGCPKINDIQYWFLALTHTHTISPLLIHLPFINISYWWFWWCNSVRDIFCEHFRPIKSQLQCVLLLIVSITLPPQCTDPPTGYHAMLQSSHHLKLSSTLLKWSPQISHFGFGGSVDLNHGRICSNCVTLSSEYGSKSLRNQCYKELRQFWRQKAQNWWGVPNFVAGVHIFMVLWYRSQTHLFCLSLGYCYSVVRYQDWCNVFSNVPIISVFICLAYSLCCQTIWVKIQLPLLEWTDSCLV